MKFIQGRSSGYMISTTTLLFFCICILCVENHAIITPARYRIPGASPVSAAIKYDFTLKIET